MLKKMDKTLLITSMLLFLIGLIMIFSASNVTAFMKYDVSPYYIFNKQLIYLAISMIMALIILKFKTKSYGFISWILMIALIVLLIVVLMYGKITNQAKSWLTIVSGVKLQPSEFIKVASIVWVASYITRINKENQVKSYLLLLGIILGVFILIFFQPDLGTGIIYMSIMGAMITSIKISKKTKRNIFLIVLICILVGGTLLVNNGGKIILDRQRERFDYFNPCSEEKFYTTGTQVCNGFIAINNGGLLGKGLGNSTQKYLYLPEAYTDFIFAIVVEELGLIVSLVILFLMFIVLWRIFIIGKRTSDNQNRLICYGVFWYILIHIIVNLGGITGLIPLTGVPLPFLSYGGSFLMCLVVSIAIVQRIAIENKS